MCLESFPCNTKPQTKLRQKGHAVKRMGSSFSCTSSLHSPSCPTSPCKRLLPRPLSVPDFTSFSHSSQRQHLDFWKSKSTLSQGLVDQKQFCASHGQSSKSTTVTAEVQKFVSVRWDSQRGSTQLINYFWSFLRCCPWLTQ